MKKEERFWDFLAGDYDREPDDPSKRKDLEAILKHLNPGDVVLDFACGTGTLSIELASRVKEIHAIDISSRMLAAASRKASERKVGNIRFLHTTIFDEALTNAAFDVVMAFNILHLLDDVQQVLRRINHLLKPGGVFISSTPCMGEKQPLANNILFSLFLLPSKLGIIPPIRVFTVNELETLIKNERFQSIETNLFYDEAPSYFMIARKMV